MFVYTIDIHMLLDFKDHYLRSLLKSIIFPIVYFPGNLWKNISVLS